MSVVVQLSDLHLLGGAPEQDDILASLLAALERDRQERGRGVDLVVITGDVFDSADVDRRAAVREMLALHRNVMRALGPAEDGGDVPTIVVPGNHDRRRIGLFGPQRGELFAALREAAPPRLFVHGCATPFLSHVVDPAFHRQPFWAVAYDSSYLPEGWLSAGGVVRREDLLHAAAVLGDREPEWPVLFLLHHHLVPTPLTDLGPIETHRLPAIAHFALHRILPRLVSHADREELTMTALGAGTALAALHAMDRAVLVLHGHKHIAAARKIEGTRRGQGDVPIVSAGSAGTAQRWTPGATPDAARLWPSFNVIELEGDAITAETVAFGWKGRSAGAIAARPLVWAAREGSRWLIAPIDDAGDERAGPHLATNESVVTLRPSATHGAGRFDYGCVRTLAKNGRRRPQRYVEVVEGPPRAALVRTSSSGREERIERMPARVELAPGGQSRYRVEGGACRTWSEALAARGATAAPFESVALMNRYAASEARLALEGLGARSHEAFASAMDLGTGEERPLRCHASSDRAVVELPRCPPRTLLRIRWPLAHRA